MTPAGVTKQLRGLLNHALGPVPSCSTDIPGVPASVSTTPVSGKKRRTTWLEVSPMTTALDVGSQHTPQGVFNRAFTASPSSLPKTPTVLMGEDTMKPEAAVDSTRRTR